MSMRCALPHPVATTLLVQTNLACAVVFTLTCSDGNNETAVILGNPTGDPWIPPVRIGPFRQGASTFTILKAEVPSLCRDPLLLYFDPVPVNNGCTTVRVMIHDNGVLEFS